MRQSIIIFLLIFCQQIFCADTKCQLSLISHPKKDFQTQAQRTKIQNIDELFYTVDSLNLDDNIVMTLWKDHSYLILDLVRYTEAHLLQLQGMSKKDITKIREKLLTKGLYLGLHIPVQTLQKTAKKISAKKLSFYMKFIEDTSSIPLDIPRNEFIERLKVEVEKLNNSRLYHPVQIEGYYNAKGAFKNIFLYEPTKLPDENSDILRTTLRQIRFIMMQNQIKYDDRHEI